jgi:PAS domain-containing protein
MTEPRPRSNKSPAPGLRALAACGDGFWEINLVDGSAWFSEWFYRKLGWPLETRRTAVNDLKEALEPAEWEGFMRRFRAHLEQAVPFDPRLSVKCADGRRECWQLHGSAERTDGGLPVYVSGSAREIVTAAACSCGAFDVLPVAAALLDAEGKVLHTNSRWRELGPIPGSSLAQQILAAASGTASVDIALAPPADPESIAPARGRALTGRATRHAGTQLWVAVLEDR